jgi:hypothetical protein
MRAAAVGRATQKVAALQQQLAAYHPPRLRKPLHELKHARTRAAREEKYTSAVAAVQRRHRAIPRREVDGFVALEQQR